jgi:hypothetical protein
VPDPVLDGAIEAVAESLDRIGQVYSSEARSR